MGVARGSQRMQSPWLQPLSPHIPPQEKPGLTFAGFPIAAQAEPRAAAAGPALVAVPEQANVRAASWLPKLIWLAGVAPNCNTEHGSSGWENGGTGTRGRGDALVGPPWVLEGSFLPGAPG